MAVEGIIAGSFCGAGVIQPTQVMRSGGKIPVQGDTSIKKYCQVCLQSSVIVGIAEGYKTIDADFFRSFWGNGSAFIFLKAQFLIQGHGRNIGVGHFLDQVGFIGRMLDHMTQDLRSHALSSKRGCSSHKFNGASAGLGIFYRAFKFLFQHQSGNAALYKAQMLVVVV